MKTELLVKLADKPYFTPVAVEQLSGRSGATVRQLLWRWYKTGKVLRLKQGYYMARDFYVRYGDKPGFVEMVSQVVEPYSYVSREYVLQQHGVLTEGVYGVTAVTAKNTHRVENQIGLFEYCHVQDRLYRGWKVQQNMGIECHVATKAKALFDYLYLRLLGEMEKSGEYNLAEDLRLKLKEFTEEERREWKGYVVMARSPKMTAVDENLWRCVWRD